MILKEKTVNTGCENRTLLGIDVQKLIHVAAWGDTQLKKVNIGIQMPETVLALSFALC